MTFARALRPSALAIAALSCKPSLRSLNEGFAFEPGVPKPDIVLTATDGRPFRLREDTEGKVVLLYFGYTHCPDVCPVTMANLAAALGALSPEINREVRVVFVTTDPRRDTPPVLRAWLDHFDPRFVGLRGGSAQIAAVLQILHLGEPIVVPGANDTTYAVEHAAMVLGFTRDDLAHVGYPFGIRQEDWVQNIQALVKQ